MAAGVSVANDAATLRKDTGWSSGLVVVYGPAELALDLGKDGRQLVAWFSSDIKAVSQMREKILAAGLQGIVTADVCPPGKIPLRGELANVVAVDVEAAGNRVPPEAELKRVLVPLGSLYRKRDGRWVEEKMPRRKEYASWTHLNAQANGNPRADDKVADLPRGLQWLGPDTHRWDPLVNEEGMLTALPVRRRSYRGLRPPDDLILPQYAERWADKVNIDPKYRSPDEPITMIGMDPFNGLPRWTNRSFAREIDSWLILGRQAWFIHLTDDPWVGGLRSHPFGAVDIRTGEPGARLTDGPRDWRFVGRNAPREGQQAAQIIGHGDRVYMTGRRLIAPLKDGVEIKDLDPVKATRASVVALDAATGKRLWAVDGEGLTMSLPTLSPDGKRLYCLEGDAGPKITRYFGQRQVRALLCIDTKDGRVLWRTQVPENEVSHMIALDDGVLVGRLSMHAWNVGLNKKEVGAEAVSRYQLGVDRLHADDGRIVWSYRGIGNNNMLVMGNRLFVGGSMATARIDLATGAAQRLSHPNVGCQRMFGLHDRIGLANLLFLNWPVDRTVPSWTYVGITHPDCGMGLTVANGRFFVASNFMCGCNRMLRMGYALHAEHPPAPDADATRLRPGSEIAAPTAAPLASKPPETLLTRLWQDGYYGRPGAYWAIVPVRDDDTLLGVPAKSGDLIFIPRVHAQRLEAWQGETLVWAQQLGGRPSAHPVASGDLIIQPARDGYVYAFDARTGRGAWRFLAARTDHRLVNAAQLESVWPCSNAILYKGAVAVATGFTVDTDGGGMIWGLDPATGQIRWRVQIATENPTGEGDPARNRASFQAHHSHGGTAGHGWPIQRIREHNGDLMLGQWQTHNFQGGANRWDWLPIDITKERVDPIQLWLDRDKRVSEFECGTIGSKPEWMTQKK